MNLELSLKFFVLDLYLVRSIIINENFLNRVMQNMEIDSANEVNTLYHSVLPNTINSQQHSTHATSMVFVSHE